MKLPVPPPFDKYSPVEVPNPPVPMVIGLAVSVVANPIPVTKAPVNAPVPVIVRLFAIESPFDMVNVTPVLTVTL